MRMMEAWDRARMLQREAERLRARLKQVVDQLNELVVSRGGRFGDAILWEHYQRTKTVYRRACFRAYCRRKDVHAIEDACETGPYDDVRTPCPICGTFIAFQSTAGSCSLATYTLRNAPVEIIADLADEGVYCTHCDQEVRLVVRENDVRQAVPVVHDAWLGSVSGTYHRAVVATDEAGALMP